MKTAQKILDIARGEIGTKENPAGSNRTKYGVAYGWNGCAWCVIFVWWCFHQAGAADLLPVKTASCWALMDAAKRKGLWVTSDYKPGDVLIYDFPGNPSTTDHTGICESVSGDTVTAIEGNTGTGNDANGGQVMRRTRKVTVVKGAVRPKYSTAITVKPVTVIAQEVLDGKWGNGDERRARLAALEYNPADVQTVVNALAKGGFRVQVTASVLNVRAGPGTNFERLDIFGSGVILTVEEVREGKGASAWGRVGNGWISLDYVREV